MARYAKIYNNFTGGELSPEVFGRVDLPQYQNGCEIMENFIPRVQGGAWRRPGTVYVGDYSSIGTSAAPTKVIPFSWNDDGTDYQRVITLYDGTIRVTSLSSIGGTVSLTNCSFANWSDTVYDDIHYAQVANFLYIAVKSYKPIVIAPIDLVAYDIDNANLYDTTKDLVKSIPFQDSNVDTSSTITPSATSGTVTLTATSAIKWGDYIQVTHGSQTGVAKILGIVGGSGGTSTTAETLTGFNFGATTASDDYKMSLWGQSFTTGFLGYPDTVAYYQNRLLFGGSYGFPDTIIGSESSNIKRFLLSELAQWGGSELQTGNAAAFRFTLTSGRGEKVQWMIPSGKGDLAIGTSEAEYIGYAPDTGSGFGATNVRFDRQSQIGSSHVQPVMFNESVIYIASGGQSVRAFSFSDSIQSYASTEINLLANHLLRSAYADRASQFDWNTTGNIPQVNSFSGLQVDSNNNLIWILSAFGDIYSLSLDLSSNSTAFARQVLAGTTSDGEAPYVYSMAVIKERQTSGRLNPRSLLFLATKRDLSGTDNSVIEYISPFYERSSLDFTRTDFFTGGAISNNYHPVYVDLADYSGPGSSGSPGTDSFNGFSYFPEGTTVYVVGDGVYDGATTVGTGGIITTSGTYTSIIAGLPYTHKLKTTRVETGSQIGTSQGLVQRIHKVVTRLYRSAQLKIGDEDETSKMEEFTFDNETVGASDTPIALFTGDKTTELSQDYEGDAQVYIEGDKPLPLNISAIIAVGEVNSG